MKSHLICLALVLFKLIGLYNCQSTLGTLALVKPTDCNSSQYYDITHLACVSCPPNTGKQDLYNCKCLSNYLTQYNYGGGQVACSACSQGQIQSSDGYSCVACDTTCQNCGTQSSYRTDTNQDGSALQVNGVRTSTCITCQPTTSLLINSACESCSPFVFTLSTTDSVATVACNSPELTSSSGFLLFGASVPVYDYTVQFGTDSFASALFAANLQGVYLTCQNAQRRNVTSCQALANLCVLKLYVAGSVNSNSDACTLFNSIVSPTTTQTLGFWPANLPWLLYPQTLAVYRSSYDLTGIGNGQWLGLQYTQSYLSFYAAQYSLYGQLLTLDVLDISRLQLCNYITNVYISTAQVSPFSATNYYQSCSVSVQSLLGLGASPIFYDIYLKYDTTQNLLPLPIVVSTGTTGTLTNPNLERRLFLVDSVSALQLSASSAQPKYIRYAKSIKLEFLLSGEGEVNGQIYPPTFYVTYDFVSTANLQSTVAVSFEISYVMNLYTEEVIVGILTGVLALMSFFWAVFRTWIWNKRSGKLSPDLVTLFKFFMFLCSSLGNVLFLIMIGLSLYWLIIFKGQTLAFVVVPSRYQEVPFVVCLIVSFTLKLVDVVHLIFTQSSYDIFFIDWERPKAHDTSSGLLDEATEPMLRSGVIARAHKNEKQQHVVDHDIREYNRVSCWRTLFVANEWNELQTFRKINPTIQLVGVLFFLKVINLEALTTADCNTSISPDINAYQAPYSAILRVAMAASMWLGMGLFQYLLYQVIYIRCFEDKTSSFMDLCSVANISMFIMSHTQFGYYIHGRSPHGNADTSMQDMTRAFMKEQNDIMARRGLGHNSEQQAFSISISDRLSRQYRKVMDPLLERKPPRTLDGVISSEYEKRILAYSQLNKFLAGFIENVLRDLKYMIVKRNFFENVLDIEFKEPILNGYFYADDDKSFENVLFCGQERRLFVFDLLTFLLIDFFAQNYVLAAFIVYIFRMIYNTLRNDLGTRNLSRKTLVDKRFLI